MFLNTIFQHQWFQQYKILNMQSYIETELKTSKLSKQKINNIEWKLTTPKDTSWCKGSCVKNCKGADGGNVGGWAEGG